MKTNPMSDLTPTKPPTSGHTALTDLPMIIIVGLTGVGKSTTLDLLAQAIQFTLLPNRRQITDDLMISYLQQTEGQPVQPVTDRLLRFEYTARYRQKFPGGMAHALTQLTLNPQNLSQPLLFDGLRGINEIAYAAKHLPFSRFIMLDAPDLVRLQRLLNRADAFDQVGDAGSIDAGLQTWLLCRHKRNRRYQC